MPVCWFVFLANPNVFSHISALRGVQLEAAKQLRLEAFTAAQEAHHLKPLGEMTAYDSLVLLNLVFGD